VSVATLYDVHGNLPALEAVLADVPEDAAILVGGDVAAGPYPAEALERLRSLGDRALWIRGNADRELTPGEEGLAPPEVLEWVRRRLSAEQLAFLYALPVRLEVEIDGLGRVLFCHATPENDVDVFLEGTSEEAVAPVFAPFEADLFVCGHTHMQFVRDVGGRPVVNAGSVGMAYEDEPGAYWALLGPDVELRRTPYDGAGLADAGFPGRTGPGLPGRAEATEFFSSLALRA
jgi:predicted phosphodiesterase